MKKIRKEMENTRKEEKGLVHAVRGKKRREKAKGRRTEKKTKDPPGRTQQEEQKEGTKDGRRKRSTEPAGRV